MALFASNQVGVIWTVCWWLVAYCPGGYVDRVTQLWYIKVRLWNLGRLGGWGDGRRLAFLLLVRVWRVDFLSGYKGSKGATCSFATRRVV